MRSFCLSKLKFYRCFNAIYCKASCASEEVIINLFKSYCLPSVMYSCESVPPSKSDIKTLNKLITMAFQKIFHTYDANIIQDTRFIVGMSDIADILSVRQKTFLNRFLQVIFFHWSKVLTVCLYCNVVLVWSLFACFCCCFMRIKRYILNFCVNWVVQDLFF